MCDVAARLVDRVLPAVPVRQWVLSLPFELRGPAAFRASVLSALVRIFVDAVFARLARGKREKVCVMTPLELLARISALIAPPRYPLTRYHGVLAPSSKWRRDVVPKPRERRDQCARTRKPERAKEPGSVKDDTPNRSTARRQPDDRDQPRVADTIAVDPVPPLPPLVSGVTLLSPTILSARQWGRLAGHLLAPAGCVDWPTLLRRTFAVDVLECPSCHGRMRILGSYTDAEQARAILGHLGLPSAAPTAARARDPTALLAEPD
jgi:hypothetical protein